MSEALARTQSDEVHLRQQLETAMQERDAAAKELEWVTSVQDQLNQEVKAAQQERDALSVKVKEHGRQAAADAEALRLVTADRNNLSDERDRKDQARINLEGELQIMTQSVDQTKALLRERSKETEEEHAKRDEADRKRVRQAVEKVQEEARERRREIEKQRTEIDDLKAKVTHHAAAAMDYKFKAEKLESELDELRAWHKKNGVVAA